MFTVLSQAVIEKCVVFVISEPGSHWGTFLGALKVQSNDPHDIFNKAKQKKTNTKAKTTNAKAATLPRSTCCKGWSNEDEDEHESKEGNKDENTNKDEDDSNEDEYKDEGGRSNQEEDGNDNDCDKQKNSFWDLLCELWFIRVKNSGKA